MPAIACSTAGVTVVARTSARRWRGETVRWDRRHHDRVAEIDRLECALEGPGLLGEHDGRVDQLDHVSQPAEIAGHQGIVGTDRADGHARGHAAEFHDRVRDRIAREDQQRAAGRQALVEQPLRDRIRRVLEPAERVLDPRAALVRALGDARTVGIARRPDRDSCAGRLGMNGASSVTGSTMSVPSVRRSTRMSADGKNVARNGALAGFMDGSGPIVGQIARVLAAQVHAGLRGVEQAGAPAFA